MLDKTIHAVVGCTLQYALCFWPWAYHPVAPCYALGQNLGTGQGPGLVQCGASLPQSADTATM